MVVESKLAHASTPFQQALLQVRGKLYRVEGDMQRWQKCTEFSNSALGFATGALYVNKYFSELDRLKVNLCHCFLYTVEELFS